MKTLLFLTLVVVVLGPMPSALGQSCPPAEVLSPCTCSESPLSIFCSGISREDFNLKEVMDKVADSVREDLIFNTLVLSEIPSLVEIERGAVERLKFEVITIDGNANLEYVSPQAFNLTKEVTRRLAIFGSKLNNDAPREREIFELLSGFQKLEYLDLTWNRISSIPEEAFQNLPSLRDIFLLNNRISSIGRRAFAASNLPSLGRVYLSYNSIPSGGLPADAFEGIGSSVTFHLRCNDMQHMEQRSFQPLLDGVASLNVNDGREGDCWGHTQRFHCDGRADWICDREEDYRPKLEGFLCKSSSGIRDIWAYCAGRDK